MQSQRLDLEVLHEQIHVFDLRSAAAPPQIQRYPLGSTAVIRRIRPCDGQCWTRAAPQIQLFLQAVGWLHLLPLDSTSVTEVLVVEAAQNQQSLPFPLSRVPTQLLLGSTTVTQPNPVFLLGSTTVYPQAQAQCIPLGSTVSPQAQMNRWIHLGSLAIRKIHACESYSPPGSAIATQRSQLLRPRSTAATQQILLFRLPHSALYSHLANYLPNRRMPW
mmetsp:Transcript_28988/g.46729  ORF Transcript_28988/g.46729 Transcript_28988/m.46729 type:complete len:218 (+) Transcript_28988:435-1088(+)